MISAGRTTTLDPIRSALVRGHLWLAPLTVKRRRVRYRPNPRTMWNKTPVRTTPDDQRTHKDIQPNFQFSHFAAFKNIAMAFHTSGGKNVAAANGAAAGMAAIDSLS